MLIFNSYVKLPEGRCWRKNSELTFHHVFCNKKALNNTMFQLEIAIELCVSHDISLKILFWCGPCSNDKSINFQQKLGQMPMVTFPPKKTSFLLQNYVVWAQGIYLKQMHFEWWTYDKLWFLGVLLKFSMLKTPFFFIMSLSFLVILAYFRSRKSYGQLCEWRYLRRSLRKWHSARSRCLHVRALKRTVGD